MIFIFAWHPSPVLFFLPVHFSLNFFLPPEGTVPSLLRATGIFKLAFSVSLLHEPVYLANGFEDLCQANIMNIASA